MKKLATFSKLPTVNCVATVETSGVLENKSTPLPTAPAEWKAMSFTQRNEWLTRTFRAQLKLRPDQILVQVVCHA